MKKIICLTISLFLLLAVFTACGNKPTEPASTSEPDSVADEKISVVTTIFPEYDWVREIIGEAGDKFELTLLLDNGVDLHSFQPSAADILKISTCDMFIYVGGESDGWVKDALAEAVNKDMIVIDMLEVLGDAVKEEEIVEGMQDEEECENDDDEEGPEYDEHVWLSIENAKTLVKAVTDGVKSLDPDNSDVYNSNCLTYTQKLDELDRKYTETIAKADKKTILFGDRFPFRYLTDEYGLNYYAAFAGCSAETEASFETIVFLSGKVDELGLKAVFTIEKSDAKIAETIKNNTKTKDQEILVLDSLQSVTSKDIKAGKTYISIMELNLETLEKALR